MRAIFFIFPLLSLFLLETSLGQSRTWTDIKGKTVEGTPIKKTTTSITIELESGKTATIPLSRLSEEDRTFVLTWTPQESPKTEEAPKKAPPKNRNNKEISSGPNFDDPWPKTVKISPEQDVKLVKEENGVYTYESPHFSFEVDAKLSIKLMRTLSSIFEATLEANCAMPLNFPCRQVRASSTDKYKARFYKFRPDFEKATGRPATTAGVFINGVVHVPFSSLGIKAMGQQYTIGREGDPKTLIHEITHQMTLPSSSRPGPGLPSWMLEGVAEYTGHTPYQSGFFNFNQTRMDLLENMVGYNKKTGFGRNIGKEFNIPSLKTFMTQNYSMFLAGDMQLAYGFSSLLYYYFCHIDGDGDAARLKKYMQAIQAGKSMDEINAAILDGRTWETMAKDVQTGMRRGLKLKPTIGP